MSKSTAQCIVLTQKAEVKQARITLQNGSLSLESVKTYLKKKETPEILGVYRYKTFNLTLFGYTSGKAGNENKHELPPPLDSNLCFGDIILIASLHPADYTKPTSFKSEEYETFYTKAFGGFEDLDSEDEQEDDDEEEEVQEEKEKTIVEEVDEDEEEDADEEGDADVDGEAEPGPSAAPDVEGEVDEEIRPAKASKKKRATAAAATSGASQVLHIPKEEHLVANLEADDYPLRLSTIDHLESLLNKNSIDGLEVAHLEMSIYNATIAEANTRHVTCHWKNTLFVHIYQTKVRHILGNIIPSTYVQNTKLLSELRSGKYTLDTLCSADTYTICNERWRDFIHRRGQREKRQLEGNKAMATDQFYCGQCHKRECTYYEMQTRSADEPMTIFITCLNCGKHWRQ
jgi:DNA-directed RNA polymerase subunit M/transcription elongation factor TFIIS